MENQDNTMQETTSVEFGTLSNALVLNQPDEFVMHFPAAYASPPMVPPDYQVTAWFPRQLPPHTDSKGH